MYKKYADWLSAIVNAIMTYIGLICETKLRSLGKWLLDEKRFTPTNESTRSITDLWMNIVSSHPIKPPVIPMTTWKTFQNTLSKLQFNKKSIHCFQNILKTESPLSHSRTMLQKLSLNDKWHFAQNISHFDIPMLAV